MITFGVFDALVLLAFPVTAIVARLFENRVTGIAAGTFAGLALFGIAIVLSIGDAFSEIDLEVPD